MTKIQIGKGQVTEDDGALEKVDLVSSDLEAPMLKKLRLKPLPRFILIISLVLGGELLA